MKTLFHSIVLFSIFFTCTFFSLHAQGLIVNEGGNGQGGDKDFFELLVIGSTQQPTGTVDLTGWIIDDNNGEFGGTGSGKGIAQGHIRLKSTCFSNVPIGSIIVIYNPADKETLIPADDPTDANGDMVYILPSSHSCIERCSSYPTTSNKNYNSGSCSYSTMTTTQWSGVLGLSGDQDAFQVRQPNGTFFHGFGYGFSSSLLNTAPNFPAELGGGKSFNFSGTGKNTSINFSCGALNAQSSYAKEAAATFGTPGAPNNADNAMLIANIRAGNFDYSDWSNPANCETPILPLELLSFEVQAYSLLQNQLTWQLAKVDPYSFVHIERSANGITFETVATLSLEATMEMRHYSYLDQTPYYTTYYRLRFEEPTSLDSYSAIRVITHQRSVATGEVSLYPNPTNNLLNLAFADANAMDLNYTIIDALGRVAMQGVFPANEVLVQISTQDLPSGTYMVRLDDNQNVHLIKKFVKI